MKFWVSGLLEEEKTGVYDILEERGYSWTDKEEEADIRICAERQDGQGYKVARSAGLLKIFYSGRRDFFRAFGIALARIHTLEFVEGHSGGVGNAGVMFDCSRNSVLRVKKIKQFIRQMALMGLNELLLYTEDTYEVEGYPYFGALRGRYAREEIQECDAYAKKYGVEMIPCIQTLAHLRTLLRWPAMMKYRDDEDILCAGEEITYRLIDAMISSLRKMYSSPRIHLGMDEAFYLGLGNYRKKHGVVEQRKILKEHLSRVMEICDKYKFEPMIWSDMFFVSAGQGDYYNVPGEYEWPEDERPDRGVTLVYWDYEGHDKNRYNRMARLHKKLSDKVYFAGGSWIWNGLSPNYAKAMDATKAAMEGLKGTGVSDSFLTMWQDNGAETPVDTGLLMMAFYSRCVYGESVKAEDMEEWFHMLTGESFQDLLLLDRLDHIPGTGGNNEWFANPSKTIFYQDPLVGIFDSQFAKRDLPEYYRELAGRIKKAQQDSSNWKTLYGYYAALADILSVKCELGFRIRNAYLSDGKKELETLKNDISLLEENVEEARRLREKLWMEDGKPNGFEVLDIRISGVEARLRSARLRIEKYLSGEIGELEELAEERPTYLPDGNEGKKIPSCNLWESIVSAANIKGV